VLNPSTTIAPDSSGGGGPFQSAIVAPTATRLTDSSRPIRKIKGGK
jgi:hypothetical protein